jgi:hypothetical protein
LCDRIIYPGAMNYEVRHNGVLRSYRDEKSVAYEAARFAKERAKGDIIEIVELATGAKLLMLADGRTV